MVRQEDYTIGRAMARQKRRLRRFHLCLAHDAPAEVTLQCWRKAKDADVDVLNIRARNLQIQSMCFNLNTYSEEQALHNFRFRKRDILKVCEAVGWTAGRTKRSRYFCEPMTATCIMLKRLSCSVTWYDLEPVFGTRYSHLSEIFWEIVETLVENKGYLITELCEQMLQERAELYAKAIRESGAPLDSCVGFIDCTKINISRPGGSGANQRSCYSGHKRFHCLIYQTITTPDGLIFSLYGPQVGRRHDLTLLRESGIEQKLESCLLLSDRQFYIYGDAAYVLRPWLQTAFDRATATMEQAIYNTGMNRPRTSVEWNFKDLKQIWTRNDFSRLLHVRQFPVALLYVSSALLLNFKTCMERWGQVGRYFLCNAPSFEEYINQPPTEE